jgi:hypothetical protein
MGNPAIDINKTKDMNIACALAAFVVVCVLQ